MKNITLLITLFVFTMPSMAKELPENSIYHIDSNWVNQNKNELNITDLTGKIQVVAFVYTYCEHSCPIIMTKLKIIEKQLSEDKINDVHFSLFSLDPIRDTPEELLLFSEKHALTKGKWGLYNGNPDDVLELAALVGVRYKPMNNDNNDIAHSNMITILDSQGVIVYQIKGFSEDMKLALKAITEINL